MSSRTATQAIKELLDGNKRFVAGESTFSVSMQIRREQVSGGQNPFAAIVACSDSRVPPELIFDQTLGNIFVVRTAGSAMDAMSFGSLEYAVGHLRVPLVLVLGHTKCGALEAAARGDKASGHLSHVMAAIAPAVEKARAMQGDLVSNAVKVSTEMLVARISSPKTPLGKLVREKGTRVAGAIYDLDTGLVKVLPTLKSGN
ncbi:MAG: carbonic anhydrase [Methanobacteriota archaeon]